MVCYFTIWLKTAWKKISWVKLASIFKLSSRLQDLGNHSKTKSGFFSNCPLTIMNVIFSRLFCIFQKALKNAVRKFRNCFLHSTLFLIFLIYKYQLFFQEATYLEYFCEHVSNLSLYINL